STGAAPPCHNLPTPHPNPPPQGGGRRGGTATARARCPHYSSDLAPRIPISSRRERGLQREANGRAGFISGVGPLRRRRRLNKTRKPVRFRPGQGTASRREYVQYAGMYSMHEYAQCARVCTVCVGMYNMREYVQFHVLIIHAATNVAGLHVK